MERTRASYLKLLAELYPTIADAATEIINLSSIINLPKGTEHFISDIHGEYDAFSHVLRNGSGSIRRKIEEVYAHTLSHSEIRELASLIYYPAEKIEYVKAKKKPEEMEDWYKTMLYRLVAVCRHCASKYTRSKVRKAMPKDFAYVIEELITEKSDVEDKEGYYEEIINTIIRIGRAERCIVVFGELIQRLVIDRLHILGDIFDRGNGADKIMDRLEKYHSLDIQWGNHDILWMGAAAGQTACIANVVRICARYGNLPTLEDGYGINLLPLAQFAAERYAEDPCALFACKAEADATPAELALTKQMHKAISVIQFKLEGALCLKRPELHMQDRALLHMIDYEKGTITIGGQEYAMLDTNFPTIDPADPYALTEEEAYVVERLRESFIGCERLQRHMELLLNEGALYLVYNHNLLYHGCMPLDDEGNLLDVTLFGKTYHGKALYDALDRYVRQAFVSRDEEMRGRGRDIMWWIWCSRESPLFGKDKMATFERYFIEESETHKEVKNSYYTQIENLETVEMILHEFGLNHKHSHIINGHVPVKTKAGESPIKCGGRVLIIDGGFSKAYQKVTAIAGYTLVYNSHGMNIVAHEPFTSLAEVVEKGSDIHSNREVVERRHHRLSVGDTDNGGRLKIRIAELEELLAAYRSGEIAEKGKK